MTNKIHYVEVWTTHNDGTITLVRKEQDNEEMAQFGVYHLLSLMYKPDRPETCEPNEAYNMFDELVVAEVTSYAPGVVQEGVFQFADGEG